MVGTQDWNSVPNDQSRVRIELSILGSRATKNRPASARVYLYVQCVHWCTPYTVWLGHPGFSAVYNQKVLGPHLEPRSGMCCAGSDRGSGRFRVSKKKIELQMGFWTKIDHSGRPPNT